MNKSLRYLGIGLAVLCLTGLFLEPAYSADERVPVRTQTHLKVGDPAPDFTLPANMAINGSEKLTLSQFKGKKNVVLSFHVLDWTPV